MHDLREVFEMVTKQTEPDLDSWKKQEDRQRSRSGIAGSARSSSRRRRRRDRVFSLIASRCRHDLSDGTTDAERPVRYEPPDRSATRAPDGTPLRQFPGSFSERSSLQLSPDGTTLAYMFAGYVHTVRVDGSDDRTLTGAGNTNDGDAQNHVVWSPDGSQLAYAYAGNIYVMNSDGSDQHAITRSLGGLGYYYPVWSIDGTIAFWGGSPTGEDGGPSDADIYTIPATGGPVTRLTHDADSDIEPAWSPNGSRSRTGTTEPSGSWALTAVTRAKCTRPRVGHGLRPGLPMARPSRSSRT